MASGPEDRDLGRAELLPEPDSLGDASPRVITPVPSASLRDSVFDHRCHSRGCTSITAGPSGKLAQCQAFSRPRS